MEQRACEKCGAPMAPSASFCPACDTFIGWYVDSGAAPAASSGTGVRPGPGGSTQTGADRTVPRPAPPERDRVTAPVASVQQAEVTVAPGAPGLVEVVVKNESTIVDSYEIRAADPPQWLSVTHGDANLLPGAVGSVTVTFAVPPGGFAVAQRVTVPLRVSSSVDPTCATPLSIDVVVPPSGPDARVVARPNLLRLQDTEAGRFDLHFDNRAANYDREYELAAGDPEGVVRFDVEPPVVDVPAGGTAEATVRFTAPTPAPGTDLSRQLTVTATDADGTVSVPVSLTQSTSPAPESLPVRLRLEPAHVTMVDTVSTAITVVLDNRGGHEPAKFTVSGRDPSNQVRFHFEHPRVSVGAGNLGYLQGFVETAPPPRGESVTRPISVVAVADDGSETEASGTLEVTSRPAAISTAQLRVHPEHLVATGRKGRFTIDLDNRQGGEPLQVHLSGADEYGRARLTFQPTQVVVPPGQIGRAGMVIQHPRPDAGTSESRRVQVMASSGVESIRGEAVFTQHTTNRRRLWGVLLVLLGALLVGLGVVVWAVDPAFEGIERSVRSVIDAAMAGVNPDFDDARATTAAGLLALLVLCAAMMLIGLSSRTGRLVRTAALVAVACGVGVLIATAVATGIGFVVAGAVAAFVGGILIRA